MWSLMVSPTFVITKHIYIVSFHDHPKIELAQQIIKG